MNAASASATRRKALSGPSITGTLVALDLAGTIPAPFDVAKAACFSLGLLVLLPIVLMWWFIDFVMRVVGGRLLGGRRGNGQLVSVIEDIFLFRLFRSFFPRRGPVPAYQFIVNTPTGTVVARQEGEFAFAKPIVGSQVTLWGRMRDGVLVVSGGRDETNHVQFRRPWSTYALALPFIIMLLAMEAALVLGVR